MAESKAASKGATWAVCLAGPKGIQLAAVWAYQSAAQWAVLSVVQWVVSRVASKVGPMVAP